MPPVETFERRQKAQYWAYSGVDGHGDPTVSAVATLTVRWEWGRREGMDALGNTIALDATVFVDREIPINSIMWRGTAAELAATTSPTYYIVTDYRETPDLKNRNFRREVTLMRHGNSLPTIA